MSEFGTVTTTVDTPELAQQIATALVEAKLAACVQTQAVTSTYVWQGNIEHSNELLLTAKTMSSLNDEVETKIRSLHTYDTPEIVTAPLYGSTDYLAWIQSSVKGPSYAPPSHLP